MMITKPRGKFQSMHFYVDREKYNEFQKKLKDIPMSVWLRKRIEKALNDEEEINL